MVCAHLHLPILLIEKEKKINESRKTDDEQPGENVKSNNKANANTPVWRRRKNDWERLYKNVLVTLTNARNNDMHKNFMSFFSSYFGDDGIFWMTQIFFLIFAIFHASKPL